MRKNIKLLVSLFFILFLKTPLIYTACSCSSSSSGCTDCSSDTQPVCCNSKCYGYPFLLPRSQGKNAARSLVGTQEFVNLSDMDSNYSCLSLAVEYQKSFWQKQIPYYFFGQDYIKYNHLLIQGSQVQDRDSRAWIADYFGLPSDYESRITFCPKVQNAIVDFNFYYGLDKWAQGLYVKINMPIAWTKCELNPCEEICTDGIKTFSAGYMSESEIPRENLSKSFLQYTSGKSTFGDMQSPVAYGLIGCNNCTTKTRLADLRISLGYNAVIDQDYHFGFFFQCAAPTGNRPNAKYLFEPIVGNGHHWELGAGLSGSWIFYRNNECEDRYVGIWADATITHLLKNNQCRSFDFNCKTNSRYMLLEKMGTNNDDIKITLDDDTQVADYQYKKNLIPAINWSTFNIDVRIDIEADIAIKLGFVHNNSSFDIGYNFWARTGEIFTRECCCAQELPKDYAIKGDAFVYGFYGDVNTNTPVPLSATQSKATIHTVKNQPIATATTPASSNPAIDNPNPENYLTFAGTNQLFNKDFSYNVNTSIQPVILSRDDINLHDSPSALTHKIFVHFNYAWDNHDYDNCDCENNNIIPFAGFGGEVEFAPNRCKLKCNPCTNPCTPNSEKIYGPSDYCCDRHCSKRMGISQWGVWFKGGLSFN